MPVTSLRIDFYGIPLTVSGVYREQEPEVNAPAAFEIHSVRVSVVAAGAVRQEELADEGLNASVMEYIETEALEQIEAGFEAAAEEAANARREARRDAARE